MFHSGKEISQCKVTPAPPRCVEIGLVVSETLLLEAKGLFGLLMALWWASHFHYAQFQSLCWHGCVQFVHPSLPIFSYQEVTWEKQGKEGRTVEWEKEAEVNRMRTIVSLSCHYGWSDSSSSFYYCGSGFASPVQCTSLNRIDFMHTDWTSICYYEAFWQI